MKTPTSDQEFSEAWNVRAQNQADAAIRRGNALAAAVRDFCKDKPRTPETDTLTAALSIYETGTAMSDPEWVSQREGG